MKYCPITYEPLQDNQNYSIQGLRSLAPKLTHLSPLQLTADELNTEALSRVGKMSIQGIQPKLSAQLKIKDACFKIVDQKGHYILKPQSKEYPELPENEAITMTLAKQIGIEVPVHGLLYSKDNSMTYFIKRFDRTGHTKKIAVEDFAQLSGATRDTKYQSSMEKVIRIIEKYCSFPKIEFLNLFRLVIFNFLIGNEDMHLKNFSLITRNEIITLSPAYDLLNTTIALPRAEEELALPINGKKNNLRKSDLIDYFGISKMNLTTTVINDILQQFTGVLPRWDEYISRSYLSPSMQRKYRELLNERATRLNLL